MAIDGFVPDANFENIHVMVVRANGARTWQAARRFIAGMRPRGVAALPLLAASVLRGDIKLKRRSGEPVRLRAGERIGDPAGGVVLAVSHLDDEREIVVTGRHRFAEFATNLYVEPLGETRSRVYNVTRARFRSSPLARSYLFGVNLFHDAYVAGALRRIKRIAEAKGV